MTYGHAYAIRTQRRPRRQLLDDRGGSYGFGLSTVWGRCVVYVWPDFIDGHPQYSGRG